MKYVSVSEARKLLAELMDTAETTVITRHGVPASVVMDFDRYRAMELDLDLIRDPERTRILDQHKTVQSGDSGEFTDVEGEASSG